MPPIPRRITTDAVAKQWMLDVSNSALAFESRWTRLALRRHNPQLAEDLHVQERLFSQSLFSGNPVFIAEHGAAMIRGYNEVTKAMEVSGEEDDAYMLGADPQSGMRVAIGQQKACAQRVRRLYGQDVIWITPDEVAVLMASVEQFKVIGAVKRFFPGAEIVRRYEEEGCSDG
jgi:hypothetical protein